MPSSLQPSVAAVILAAGRSTRMGQAKQLLLLRGITLLETTIATVNDSQVSEIVLVLGAAEEAIRAHLSEPRLSIVVNPAYEQGMATSLQAGISALSLSAAAALIVLGDQPFVRPETLDQLIHEYAHAYARTRQRILIPTYRGTRGNPVLIDRALFPQVMELRGDVGCRALFARHPTLNVAVEDEGILLDIDNQEDYRRLKGGSPPRTGG